MQYKIILSITVILSNTNPFICIGQNQPESIQIFNNKTKNEIYYLFEFGAENPIDTHLIESGKSAFILTKSDYPLYSISIGKATASKLRFFKDKEYPVQLIISDSGIIVKGSRLDSLWRQAINQQDTMLKKVFPLMGIDTSKVEYLRLKEHYENWAYQKFNSFLSIDTFVALRFLNFHVPKLLQLTEVNTNIINDFTAIINGEQFCNHPLIIKTDLVNNLNNLSYLKIGAMRYDFDYITPEGDTLNTKKLYARKLLVDFGASWCKPCREKNIEMKKFIEKIEFSGITVIGISLDESKSAWLDYLHKDNLPWRQGILPKYIRKEVQKKYNAHAIPLAILFSEEGKVININPTLSQLLNI